MPRGSTPGRGPKRPGTPWADFREYTEIPVPLATAPGSYRTIRALVLKDGTKRFGCIDCKLAWGTLSEARFHRGAEHPDARREAAKARKRARLAAEAEAAPEPEPPVEAEAAPESEPPRRKRRGKPEAYATTDGGSDNLPASQDAPGGQRNVATNGIEAGLDINGVLIPALVQQLVDSRADAVGKTRLMRNEVASVCEMLRTVGQGFMAEAERLEALIRF